jgi:hypothetical protein
MQKLANDAHGNYLFVVSADMQAQIKKHVGDTVRLFLKKDRLSFPDDPKLHHLLRQIDQETEHYFTHQMDDHQRNHYLGWIFEKRGTREQDLRRQQAAYGIMLRLTFGQMKKAIKDWDGGKGR